MMDQRFRLDKMVAGDERNVNEMLGDRQADDMNIREVQEPAIIREIPHPPPPSPAVSPVRGQPHAPSPLHPRHLVRSLHTSERSPVSDFPAFLLRAPNAPKRLKARSSVFRKERPGVCRRNLSKLFKSMSDETANQRYEENQEVAQNGIDDQEESMDWLMDLPL